MIFRKHKARHWSCLHLKISILVDLKKLDWRTYVYICVYLYVFIYTWFLSNWEKSISFLRTELNILPFLPWNPLGIIRSSRVDGRCATLKSLCALPVTYQTYQSTKLAIYQTYQSTDLPTYQATNLLQTHLKPLHTCRPETF